MSKRLKLLASYLLLDSEESDAEEDEIIVMMLSKKKRKRRHSLFVNREEEGAFSILIRNHLMDSDSKFKEYFRLTPYLFNKVLDVIKGELTTQKSIRYPEPISPRLKLCLTVR